MSASSSGSMQQLQSEHNWNKKNPWTLVVLLSEAWHQHDNCQVCWELIWLLAVDQSLTHCVGLAGSAWPPDPPPTGTSLASSTAQTRTFCFNTKIRTNLSSALQALTSAANFNVPSTLTSAPTKAHASTKLPEHHHEAMCHAVCRQLQGKK